VHKAIETTDTSTLVNGMNETDIIQALVLQFLQHDGYVETARAFAEDMRVQKETLNLDPNVRVAGVNIRDDEDANNRQREFFVSLTFHTKLTSYRHQEGDLGGRY
jgi:hypothetical protein